MIIKMKYKIVNKILNNLIKNSNKLFKILWKQN